ncbi:MAG: hypothetical protein AAF740_09040 [Bacteroidota bacterium]
MRTFAIFLLALGLLSSCCREHTETFITQIPIWEDAETLRTKPITFELPRPITTRGKMYYRDGFLFINEPDEGVHIIDNRNPESPQQIGFIVIAGNHDMVVKNNVLIADSYIDLVSIDLGSFQSPTPRVLERKEGIFAVEWVNYSPESNQILTGYEEIEQSYTTESCSQDETDFVQHTAMAESADAANLVGGSFGVSGSMARMVLAGDYLYALASADNWSENKLITLDASFPSALDELPAQYVPGAFETIFPYRNHLFFGAADGLYIYDISTPAQPEFISMYSHFVACDPVVVQGDYAYVTLRSGQNWCMNAENQLEVVDISDITRPHLVKAMPMSNPHGLGVDNDQLFVCDGDVGLKLLNVEVPTDPEFVRAWKDWHAYDVIPLPHQKVLMMIGDDGLYQLDYSDPADIKWLSHLSM